MSSTPEKIAEFRLFVCDDTLTDAQISKFLIWGKGNFEMSLNYYYNSKTKNDFKEEISRPTKEKEKSKAKENQREKVVAWEKLKDGANKQGRVQQYIEELKREYNLPVVGVGKKNQKEYFKERSQEGFGDVDYLPSVMDWKGEKEERWEEGDYGEEENIDEQEEEKFEKVIMESIKEDKHKPTKQLKQVKQIKHQKETQQIENIQDVKQTRKGPVTRRHTSLQTQKPYQKSIQKKPSLTTKAKFPQPLPQKPKQTQLYPSPPSKLSTHPPHNHHNPSHSKQLISQFFSSSPSPSILIGQCFIDCFSIHKSQLSKYSPESYIELKPYASSKPISKSTAKTKSLEQKLVIRVNFNDNCIGRFEDNEARVFCHLMVEGYITMKGKLFDYPLLLSQFTGFKVRAEIYLEKKAVTIPIVQAFENQKTENPVLSEFKKVREQLNSMFMKLKLPVLTPPLIQMKSKFEINNRLLYRNDLLVENEEKASKELVEKMTNPFYKETQGKITGAFKPKEEVRRVERPAQIIEQDVNVEIKQDEYDQLINLNECNLKPTSPNPIFTSELHYYQSLALTWTLFREGFYKNEARSELHPMWTEFELPEQSGSRPLFFNQFTGQISVEPPVHKNMCKGGILADEMGLGKTVMMIALIATNRQVKSKYKTLIIVPLTLLDQWQSQIITHTKHNSLNVYKYYQKKSRTQPLQNYDVVITTYGVISNQFAQSFHINKQGLFRNEWFRVILDQAHYIKGRIIQTSRAVFALQSQINWCLTGTPIQNKLDDIYSLIHFIRYTPWSDYTWWNSYINKPHNNNDPAVFTVLRTILKNVLLRRTKQTRLENGECIVNLPKKVSRIKYLVLKEKEREFYDVVYEASKREFDDLEKQGAVEAKYMKIFEILIRLRQICCHPSLFKSISKLTNIEQFSDKLTKFIHKKLLQHNAATNQHGHFQLLIQNQQQIVVNSHKLSINQSHLQQVLTSIKSNDLGQCLICLSDLDNPVITMCLHTFCRTCLIQSINNIRGFCPLCRTIISKDDFMHLPCDSRLGADFKKEEFERSTKMQALADLVSKFEEEDKAVVFSQFLGMIDLIEEDFRRQGIEYVRMDGSLSQKERGRVIQKFKKDKNCKVFLISLKTGGVGLNLVAANKVILVDPWWNPAVEEQAIERVHRIGQKREVEVWRLIVGNSIESRMMELHESKRMVSNMAISEKENKQNFAEKFRYLMAKY